MFPCPVRIDCWIRRHPRTGISHHTHSCAVGAPRMKRRDVLWRSRRSRPGTASHSETSTRSPLDVLSVHPSRVQVSYSYVRTSINRSFRLLKSRGSFSFCHKSINRYFVPVHAHAWRRRVAHRLYITTWLLYRPLAPLSEHACMWCAAVYSSSYSRTICPKIYHLDAHSFPACPSSPPLCLFLYPPSLCSLL